MHVFIVFGAAMGGKTETEVEGREREGLRETGKASVIIASEFR